MVPARAAKSWQSIPRDAEAQAQAKEALRTLFAKNMKKVLLALLFPLVVWAKLSKPDHFDIILATLLSSTLVIFRYEFSPLCYSKLKINVI